MPFTPLYKGHKGYMTLDAKSKRWHGRVFNIPDVVTFQGETAHEAWLAFRDSLDDWLEWTNGEKK